MAWAERLPSGKWRACWRDADGIRRSSVTGSSGKQFADKPAAGRYAASREVNARQGVDDGSGAPLTWGEWLPLWLELRRVEPSTARQDAVRIERYLKPRWGSKRLSRIKRGDVQRWVNDLTDTTSIRGELLSPSTVARIAHLFTASMKAAVADEKLGASPCVGVKVPPQAPGKERYLTRAEVDAVVHHTHVNDPHGKPAENRADSRMYRCLITVGTETGLRFGELAGLHWWRVDLDHGLIHVIETWDPADRKIKAYPKGKKARAVPISNRCLEALSAMLAHRPDHKTCGLPHASGRCRSPLVFKTARGAALDAHNFGRRQWADACERAGVEGATPHDMRHTYASWLRQAGVDLEQVQLLLGHASITTTARYSHIGDTHHAAVLAALNG